MSEHIASVHSTICHVCLKRFDSLKAFKLIKHFNKNHRCLAASTSPAPERVSMVNSIPIPSGTGSASAEISKAPVAGVKKKPVVQMAKKRTAPRHTNTASSASSPRPEVVSKSAAEPLNGKVKTVTLPATATPPTTVTPSATITPQPTVKPPGTVQSPDTVEPPATVTPQCTVTPPATVKSPATITPPATATPQPTVTPPATVLLLEL